MFLKQPLVWLPTTCYVSKFKRDKHPWTLDLCSKTQNHYVQISTDIKYSKSSCCLIPLIYLNLIKMKMHSSRMRTARSLTVSPYLIVSHTCPPRINHAHPPEEPRMPPPPRATMHALPGSNHACPPGATTHAPPQSNHTPPEQPRTPPWSNHACPPRATTHPPRATMHTPPVNRMTDMCKNITFANYVCGR